MSDDVRLSFCISTRNRADCIGETLENVLEQCPPGVEVVVVDGASTDNTVAVVRAIAERHPNLRLITPERNSGFDADYDLSVREARGTYCWLFTDDDLLAPGAVERVLEACSTGPVVVIPDASVHSVDFATVEVERRLQRVGKERYAPGEGHLFLRDCALHLTFIGAVIVRRDFWLSRDRASYFGCDFIHFAVLFQAPLPGDVVVIREPLVRIRNGQSKWVERWFDVWTVKWPELIWSFDWIDEASRRSVTEREPWANPKKLLTYRSLGYYNLALFHKVVAAKTDRRAKRALPYLIATMPLGLVHAIVAVGGRILSVGRKVAHTDAST
jgi:abequosyltransferase